MRIATFSATFIPNLIQREKLKPDETGYYPTVFGAFNLVTRNNIFYEMTNEIKNMFEASSSLQRRIQEKKLRSEWGHPDLRLLRTKSEILSRLNEIRELNVCSHIRSLNLIESKDEFRKPIYLVTGWQRPSGPHDEAFKRQLDNPDESVAFSLRSITRTFQRGGQVVKNVTTLVTYDAVNDNGVIQADQMEYAKSNQTIVADVNQDLGLETLYEVDFDEADLDNAIKYNMTSAAGLENEASSLIHVRTALGWRAVQSIDTRALSW